LPALASVVNAYEVPDVAVPPVIFSPVEVTLPVVWVIAGIVI